MCFFTWIVYCDYMNILGCYGVSQKHLITSPNLRPAKLSTKVTPAENVIICLGKKGVLVVWFVNMDRGS